jgi:ribonuclease R
LKALPIGAALRIGFLKSLPRARYATEPLGHYGLAKARYTHFTSPIRRYADLAVHRSLFEPGSETVADLKRTAEHLSITERNSADAERDSKDVKMYAYLLAQLQSGQPQAYAALVTDVRNFGFFVDVQGLAMSGLVPVSTLEDDFYVFDSERAHLVGRRHRRVIRLGDTLQVEISKVDPFKKQVDFRLARTAEVRPAQAVRAGRPGREAEGGRRAGPPRRGALTPVPARGSTGGGRGVELGGRRPGGPRRQEGRETTPTGRSQGMQERTGRSSRPASDAGTGSGSREGRMPRSAGQRGGVTAGPSKPGVRERTERRGPSGSGRSSGTSSDRRSPRDGSSSGSQRSSGTPRPASDGRRSRPQGLAKGTAPRADRGRTSGEPGGQRRPSRSSGVGSGPSTETSGSWGPRATGGDGGRRGGRRR